MANIIPDKTPDMQQKLDLMREAALFDVADNDTCCMPDLSLIKSRVKGRGNPPTAPKVGLSNDCIFNCASCVSRCSRDDIIRNTFTPRELAGIALDTANQSGNAVFITSGIYKNADYTEELIIEAMRILRNELGYKGYLHGKIMPGTDPELIRKAGLYANRLSVNIEVAKSEGYEKIAKNKNKSNILTPMGQISSLIKAAKEEKGRYKPRFATSQTTQLMAGSTDEDDYTILRLANALYQKYRLSRVYYTSYTYKNPARGYDGMPFVRTPGWRMRRLYQADRLMQLYGFTPEDIAPEIEPYMAEDMDPKAAWAMRNLHLYPVEVNKADYETLLRVPGIGIVYAQRIIKARKYCTVTHEVLQALGVSLKRSRHFLTCNGKFQGEKTDKIEIIHGLLATPPDISGADAMLINQIEDC